MRSKVNQNKSRHEIYKKNFHRLLQQINSKQFSSSNEVKSTFKKAVFYGVNTTTTYPDDEYLTLDDLKKRFTEIEHVKALIENLTPSELMQVFPVDKYYRGHKFQSKDYFFTMNCINKLDMKTTFHQQKTDINKILWDYENFYITRFVLEKFKAKSQ